jgi:hypothetical protein
MTRFFDPEQFLIAARADKELNYKLRGLSARTRVCAGDAPLDLLIHNGAILAVEDPKGSADITIEASPEFWEKCFDQAVPPPGYESLTMAMGHGLTISGEFAALIAAYQGAWQRLYLVLRQTVCGQIPRTKAADPFRETDTAVGRAFR